MSEEQPSKQALRYARKEFTVGEHGYVWLDTPLHETDFGSGLLINIDCENTPEHLHDAVARHLDAYAAAALTDEQRDVLTVWEWRKQHGGVFKDDYTMLRAPAEHEWYAFGMEEDGPGWLHAAAAWVREQGAK